MRKCTRLIALLLAALLLLQGVGAAASDNSGDSDIPSGADIIVPSGWAHDALIFCVDYGILHGNTYGDLLPTHNATRAQLAAMLVRLFKAEPMQTLEEYSDVREAAWYYSEMAKAVAMGLFEGSGGKLNPEKYITREQAFTVLARAFGVASENTDVLNAFSDGDKVSLWARAGVAGLLEAGYIHGTTKGKLNPKSNITRQELAQVLYNALDRITDDPKWLTGKQCLYTGELEKLNGRTFSGDLILSVNTPEDVELSGFTVEGRLILHLHGAKRVTMEAVSQNVAVCCPVTVTLTEPVETVSCLRDGAYTIAVADNAVILGDGTLSGSYEEVTCLGGNPTIEEDTQVEVMTLSYTMSGATLYQHGTVDALHAKARRLTIQSDGKIGSFYQYYNDTVFIGTAETMLDCIDAGLEGVTLTPDGIAEAYYNEPTVTVSGVIGGVNSTQVFGLPDGVRYCKVTYNFNGTIVKTENNVPITNGTKLSCEVTAPVSFGRDAAYNVLVTVYYRDEQSYFYLPLRVLGRYTSLYEAQNVRTIKIEAKVNKTATIYSRSSLTGKIGVVSANTVVHFITRDSNTGIAALIETPDGVRGWVSASAIKVISQKYHNDSVSYSQEVMELFVNEVHQYSSNTKYLIWCNLFTTTVNIFEGSQGKWKLISTSEVTIGDPTTPTRVGEFKIVSKSYRWDFDDCYVNYASVFDGGIAFHTRTFYTTNGSLFDPSLSAERSHGCVRCTNEVAKFIFNNCPVGTRVVVY